MANVKISALPAAASANGTDQIPASQGATTRKLTNAQIATLFETILTKLVLASTKISLNADGSASFATTNVAITAGGGFSAGSVNVGGGAVVIDDLGNINIQSGVIELNADGSASFGTGVVQIDSNGNLQIGGAGGFLVGNDGTVTSNADLTLNGTNLTSTDIEFTTASTGTILKSPGGTRYRLTVEDDGGLTTTVVP
jgi:hypothetical protein